MEKEKKSGGLMLFKGLKSTAIRNTILIVILAFAGFSMATEEIRNTAMSVNLSFIVEPIHLITTTFFRISVPEFDLHREIWYLFTVLVTIICVYLFMGIFRKSFVDSIVEKRQAKNKSTKHTRGLWTTLYYIGTLFIAAAVIGIFYLFGAFRSFEPSLISSQLDTIPQFLKTYGLFLLVSLGIVVIVYLIAKLIAVLVSLVVSSVKSNNRKLEKLRDEKASASNASGEGSAGGFVGGANGGTMTVTMQNKKIPIDPNDMFPSLSGIDYLFKDGAEVTTNTEITLEEFALQFQSFAANKHKIYYGLPLIRAFVSGMASSRLIVLEGLSGTGKSMLPRMFCEFTNSKKFFAPVQATWRDKSDLLGFYSEFTKTFKTTDFLLDLYEASYTDKVNMMVLDEMNISRIEYYFADFLSILEYPSEDWKVKVYEPELNQELPNKLSGGYITIPSTTWFIGTANTDDSTFTITDKVYDRAIILNFKEKIMPIESNYNSDAINISAEKLVEMFDKAKSDESKCLNDEDLAKFLKICDFMKDEFDIRFGNRIMVQIQDFVPVYVAMGGTKEAALDYMFATKILRKLEGVYEDYIKDELAILQKLINSTYGKGTFKETERLIAKIMKRLV